MRKINSKDKRKLRNRKKLKKVNNNRYRITVSKSLNNIFIQVYLIVENSFVSASKNSIGCPVKKTPSSFFSNSINFEVIIN